VTKGEIVALLPNVTTQEEAAQLAKAVAALDVCTPGEREWLEASLSSESLRKVVVELPGSALAQARDKAIAERTPPDPVETFIARARAAWKLKRIECQEQLGYALVDLDAARGRKP
jgi:hypothetical protein